jgi:hypothetical protein
LVHMEVCIDTDNIRLVAVANMGESIAWWQALQEQISLMRSN